MTPNQNIAANMRLARVRRGWTQRQAADALRGCGFDWSIAVYSSAEQSVTGRRIRHFDADEIAAIAEALGISVGFLFDGIEASPATDSITITVQDGKLVTA